MDDLTTAWTDDLTTAWTDDLTTTWTDPLCPNDDEEGVKIRLGFVAIATVLSLFCIVSNSLVLTVLPRDDNTKRPINYFLFNLALSDLVTGIAFVIYVVGTINDGPLKDVLGIWFVCIANLVVLMTGQIASGFNLVGIMFVRYLAISHPFTYREILSQKRSRIAVVVVWCLAVAISLAIHARPQPGEYCGLCLTDLFWGSFTLVAHMTAAVFVPFLGMIWFVGLMTLSYAKHNKRMARSASLSRKKKEGKLTLMAIFLALFYISSFLPFLIVNVGIYKSTITVNPFVRYSVRILYFSNTTVNFFAYMIGHEDFRTAFHRHLCPKHYRKSRMTEVRSNWGYNRRSSAPSVDSGISFSLNPLRPQQMVTSDNELVSYSPQSWMTPSPPDSNSSLGSPPSGTTNLELVICVEKWDGVLQSQKEEDESKEEVTGPTRARARTF